MSLTVHITLPRREWDRAKRQGGEADRAFGLAIREEVLRGLVQVERRADGGDLSTIEITLVDTARVELEDDPEAHQP